MIKRTKNFLVLTFLFIGLTSVFSQTGSNNIKVRAFHIDLRIQVMKMPALKQLALQLHYKGINTLIMEWEGSYPYKIERIISNHYAYTRDELKDFIRYCGKLNIDVIPLQQTFGHVEYILRNYRYAELREDEKDFSQVCPVELEKDKALFMSLLKDMAEIHESCYMHIGGDETFLLGHCAKCQKKAAEEGLSKLYFDYIKMICDVVVALGKKPVLWADIALNYPEYIKLLPKQTVFVDWNYGWELNRFGDHEKLLSSGYEVWGAPSIRSEPDNFYLTKWANHFNNVKVFVPEIKSRNYSGIVITSWSTSGAYSTVFDSNHDPVALYPVRRVYPISGFNLLIAAYTSALHSDKPFDTDTFIAAYCSAHYRLNGNQAMQFRDALFATPYPVIQGKVKENETMTIPALISSTEQALRTLRDLPVTRGQPEFEHYILQMRIRRFHLKTLQLESDMNKDGFNEKPAASYLSQMKSLQSEAGKIDHEFRMLNGELLYDAELDEERDQRNAKLDYLAGKLVKARDEHAVYKK